MKKTIKIILVISALVIPIYWFWHFLGEIAYGEPWKHRGGSTSIKESVKRGVFVKELHFQIDSFSGPKFNFEVFIEKGYTGGHHSNEETMPLTDSRFPFQLMFPGMPDTAIGVRIREDQLLKFDSSDACCWGYLKKPALRDTIILEILAGRVQPGLIKVWQ